MIGVLSLIGLALEVTGAFVLFFKGALPKQAHTPYGIRDNEGKMEKEIKEEKIRYEKFQKLGFGLLVFGLLLQIPSAFKSINCNPADDTKHKCYCNYNHICCK